MARAVADGRTWTVLLETADQYLNRFALPMSATLTADEVANWQDCIQSAWEILVRHHGWAADSIAAGVSVLVPLTRIGLTPPWIARPHRQPSGQSRPHCLPTRSSWPKSWYTSSSTSSSADYRT